VDVFDGLDEVALAENKIDLVRFIDFDAAELHCHRLLSICIGQTASLNCAKTFRNCSAVNGRFMSAPGN
jgi:hypothetical protein